MSRKRKGLKVDGVLLLDKPVGLSSNAALQRARRALNAQKAGHTGTLDPLACGLLPLCFGEATKFSADLLNADKEYETIVRFGKTTTTGDAEGEVIEEKPVNFSKGDLLRTLEKFKGEIEQVPPMYSALKKDGVPLYELARKGQEIERKARKVVISSLDLLGFDANEAKLRVRCSKGTYIRTLGEDLGKALGCGAYLTFLRRTGIGDLSLSEAVELESFESASEEEKLSLLSPVDRLLHSLEEVELDEQSAQKFNHGMTVAFDAKKATRKSVFIARKVIKKHFWELASSKRVVGSNPRD